MEFFNTKIKTVLGLLVVALIFILVVSFYSSSQKSRQGNQAANAPGSLKEELIKGKIGDFSIEEEIPYQGGIIIKAIKKKDGANQRAVLFFKDNQLQRLPDEYIVDSIKAQLSDKEKQNKTVSIKFYEEYKAGQDKEGKDIVYKNIFFMTSELPESDWVKNAMYPDGAAKYQIIAIDEFGQLQYKFLAGEVL